MWHHVLQTEPCPLPTSKESINGKHKYRSLSREITKLFKLWQKIVCSCRTPSLIISSWFSKNVFRDTVLFPSKPASRCTDVDSKYNTEKRIHPCTYLTLKQSQLWGDSLSSGEICSYGLALNDGVTVLSRRVGGGEIAPRNTATEIVSPTNNYIYTFWLNLSCTIHLAMWGIVWSTDFRTGLLLRVWRLRRLLGAVFYRSC